MTKPRHRVAAGALLLAAALGFGPSGIRGRPVSDARRHHSHAVRRGLGDRCRGARAGGGAAGAARPAVHRREPAGRRRLAVGQRRRARQERRLHAAAHHQLDAFGGERAVQERALRSDQGFHAGCADRQLFLVHRRDAGQAVPDHAGAGRLRQGQSRQAQLRRRQLDLAHRQRDAEEADRHRHRPRALSQQSDGDDRSARRARSRS